MLNDRLLRRTWIGSAIGTIATSIAASRLTWGDPPSDGSTSAIQPSLGFSLYGMKSLPLDVAMKACAEIGYLHVEFALNAGYPTEPSVFSSDSRVKAAAMLKELRLNLPCMMVHLSLIADEKSHASALNLIQSASELGRELVPEQPPILETVLGGSPTKWEEQKKTMVDKLHDWASTAEKSKTVIAIKAHVSSAVNSPERLLWLLDEVKSPSIQIAYDYSHFELQGIDMEESMKLLLPRTRFIHVKDSIGELGKFQFVLPGLGRTDYEKYFSLLRQHSYAGPVCVEVSGQVFNKPNYEPIDAAKECYRILSIAMKKAYNQ
jgi:sugar phosphate isomerase/epimerase